MLYRSAPVNGRAEARAFGDEALPVRLFQVRVGASLLLLFFVVLFFATVFGGGGEDNVFSNMLPLC